MDFNKLIQRRRSIRKFTDEKLSSEQVESIMRAALMSPSSKGKKSWQFILIEDKNVLEDLSKCKKMASKFIADCALAIVVIANPFTSDVWIEDASIATTFMHLQAEDLGLGSCWVQIRGRETPTGATSEDYIRDLLDIPLQMQVLSVLAIGHKEQERPPIDEEQLQWEKVHVAKFKYDEE